MSRVIVMGWDGATWSLLDRLMADGKLPNLQKLAGRSVHSTMVSAHPPVTAPAWVSMATGVNPGRHGCFDFNKTDGELGKLRPCKPGTSPRRPSTRCSRSAAARWCSSTSP
jgi:predicted AlkP superfamily phosphohydrolase/phosphomutase